MTKPPEGMTMLDGARERLTTATRSNPFDRGTNYVQGLGAVTYNDLRTLLASEAAYKARVEELEAAFERVHADLNVVWRASCRASSQADFSIKLSEVILVIKERLDARQALKGPTDE